MTDSRAMQTNGVGRFGIPAPVNFLGPRGHKFIIQLVAAKHQLKAAEICSQSRFKAVVAARREAIALVYTHTRLSSSQIGAAFGRHHATVLYSLGRTATSRFPRIERQGWKKLSPLSSLRGQSGLEYSFSYWNR